MTDFFTLLAVGDDEFIAIIAIGGGLSIGALGIIAGTVKSMSRTRQVEESRRELAAYVAEGSLTPEDAETIMKANPPRERCG